MMLLEKLHSTFHSSHFAGMGRKKNNSGIDSDSQNVPQNNNNFPAHSVMQAPIPVQPEKALKLNTQFEYAGSRNPGAINDGSDMDMVMDMDTSMDMPISMDIDSHVGTPLNFIKPPNISFQQLRSSNGLQTPIENKFGEGVNKLSDMYMNAQGRKSNISLASSVSDLPNMSGSTKQQQQNFIITNANFFTRQFVNLILEIYQMVTSDPSSTPFDISNPPSGILNKVAKLSIDEAARRNIEIGVDKNNWLLTLIRYRLQHEIKNEYSISRTSSITSLPMPHNFNELLNLQIQNSSNNTNASGNVSGPGLQPAMDYFSKPFLNPQDLFFNSGYSPVLSRGMATTPTGSGSTNPVLQLSRSRSNSSQAFLSQPNLSRTASNSIMYHHIKEEDKK